MSASPNGVGRPSNPDVGTEDAFLIIGAVLGLMVALAACRFGLYSFIDACCLDDGLRRKLAEGFRKVVPWWNVRTQPASVTTTGLSSQQQQQQQHSCTGMGEQLTEEQLQQLLPSYVATAEDLCLVPHDETSGESKTQQQQGPKQGFSLFGIPIRSGGGGSSVGSNRSSAAAALKASEDSGGVIELASMEEDNKSHISDEEQGLLCSICLQRIKVGDSVYRAKCDHMFHHVCISQWASSRSTECPNCRTPMVTAEEVHAVMETCTGASE